MLRCGSGWSRTFLSTNGYASFTAGYRAGVDHVWVSQKHAGFDAFVFDAKPGFQSFVFVADALEVAVVEGSQALCSMFWAARPASRSQSEVM